MMSNSVTLDLLMLLFLLCNFSIFARELLINRKLQRHLKNSIKSNEEELNQAINDKDFIKQNLLRSERVDLTFELIGTNYNLKTVLFINLPRIISFILIGKYYSEYGYFFSVFGLFSLNWFWFHIIVAITMSITLRKIYKKLKVIPFNKNR